MGRELKKGSAVSMPLAAVRPTDAQVGAGG
jgi:hypothetical protein